MITVAQFTSDAAMLVDATSITIDLEDAGWQIIGDTTTPTGRYILFQHPDHPHDIEIRYQRNLVNPDRWARQINITWWHWAGRGAPTTSTHKLPVDCPVTVAANTYDGLPMSLSSIVAMCGELDLREVA